MGGGGVPNEAPSVVVVLPYRIKGSQEEENGEICSLSAGLALGTERAEVPSILSVMARHIIRLANRVISHDLQSYPAAAMSSGSQVQHLVVASVVGVGLVGSELIDQLCKLPSPGLRDQFQLLSLSSSRSTVYYDIGRNWWSNWRQDLAESSAKTDVEAIATKLTQVSTIEEVAGLQQGVSFSVIPVLVDNTSSEEVARMYPFFLSKGINVVTPNKKGFSSELKLYEEIVAASLKSGARFYNESTVGAGLPIISTIKDLVATGDKVRIDLYAPIALCRRLYLLLLQGDKDRGRTLRHAKLHLQRVLGWKEQRWAQLLFHRFDRQTEGLHGEPLFRPHPRGHIPSC